MSAPLSIETLVEPYITGLVYGPPGVGKSILLGCSQRLRTYVFDVDQGLISVKAHLVKYALRRDLCYFHPVRCYKDFEEGLSWFSQNQHHFDLVVVDTATELQRMVVAENCAKNRRVIPVRDDWALALVLMENLTRGFRNMKKHAFFGAHETSYKADVEGQPDRVAPAFQGQYAVQHAKHFSEIFHFMLINQQAVENDKVVTKTMRVLQCQPTVNKVVKDRSAALNMWEHPDLDVLIAKVVASTNPQQPLGVTDAQG